MDSESVASALLILSGHTAPSWRSRAYYSSTASYSTACLAGLDGRRRRTLPTICPCRPLSSPTTSFAVPPKPRAWLSGGLSKTPAHSLTQESTRRLRPMLRATAHWRRSLRRRGGELLRTIEKAKRDPNQHGQGSQRARSDAKTLKQLGLSEIQSSRWQQLGENSKHQHD